MTPCSACHRQSTVTVHGHDLCPRHGYGMIDACLTDPDLTPVGYIMAASCGVESTIPERVTVSVTETHHSEFMRHGVLPVNQRTIGTSSQSRPPHAVTAASWVTSRTISASDSTKKWRMR